MGFYGRVADLETDIFLRSCFWIFCHAPIFLAFWLTAPPALPHRVVSAIVHRLRPLVRPSSLALCWPASPPRPAHTKEERLKGIGRAIP